MRVMAVLDAAERKERAPREEHRAIDLETSDGEGPALTGSRPDRNARTSPTCSRA